MSEVAQGAANRGVTVPLLNDAEKSALAEKISDKFQAAFADSEHAELDEAKHVQDQGEPKIVKDKPESTETEEKVDEPEDSKAEQKEEATESTDENGSLILPDAHRRSLKHYEWTDEEIDRAVKSGGSDFLTSAAKMHMIRTRELQHWAAAGREARRTGTTQQPVTTTQTVVTDGDLKPVDIATLKQTYGDEPLIDALVGPINRAIQEMNAMLPVTREAKKRAEMIQLETLGKQVDSFFGGKEMKVYTDSYGVDSASLTDSQIQSRQKILEYADALIGGSRMQGRNLGLEEALQLAFDSVTSSAKEQVARESIEKSLKKREQGMIQKPGNRAQAKPVRKPGESRSRTELEASVKAKLREVFNK